MWFKVLSLIIMSLCVGKAGSALLAPRAFYRRRRQQYSSTTIPISVVIPPLVVFMLTGAAWYATLVQHVAWGWLVTAFLTLISLLAGINLFRWSRHRAVLLTAIAEEQALYRQQVDVGLLSIGGMFGLLGLIVF